eukprot:59659_1
MTLIITLLLLNLKQVTTTSEIPTTTKCTGMETSLVGYGVSKVSHLYELSENKWRSNMTVMTMGDGNTYDSFIVIHPIINKNTNNDYGYAEWQLNHKYVQLTGVVGYSANNLQMSVNSIQMRIYVDGILIYQSQIFTSLNQFDYVRLNISGRNTLQIGVDALSNQHCDHAVIANPILISDCLKNTAINTESSTTLPSTNMPTTTLSSTIKSSTNMPTSTLSSTNISTIIESSTNIPTTIESSTNMPTTTLSSTNIITTIKSSKNIPTTIESSKNISTTIKSSTNVPTVMESSKNISTAIELSTNIPTNIESSTNMSNDYASIVNSGKNSAVLTKIILPTTSCACLVCIIIVLILLHKKKQMLVNDHHQVEKSKQIDMIEGISTSMNENCTPEEEGRIIIVHLQNNVFQFCVGHSLDELNEGVYNILIANIKMHFDLSNDCSFSLFEKEYATTLSVDNVNDVIDAFQAHDDDNNFVLHLYMEMSENKNIQITIPQIYRS